MENPVYFSPAMDLDMFKHPANKANIDKLVSYGNHLIPVDSGELASGLFGEGRMADEETIMKSLLDNSSFFKGKNILITAGPTYEAIDPVRFIGNHSSGKMGIAIANAALKLGAHVTLIHGPISIETPSISKNIRIQSAQEMLLACLEHKDEADIIIMSAAVADFTIINKQDQKIKKKDNVLNIELTPTVDILNELGNSKRTNQCIVGFALETNNELNNAKSKLEKKNLDLIVLNSLNDQGAGFGTDTNKITVIDKNNNQVSYELKSKNKLAYDIFLAIENYLKA